MHFHLNDNHFFDLLNVQSVGSKYSSFLDGPARSIIRQINQVTGTDMIGENIKVSIPKAIIPRQLFGLYLVAMKKITDRIRAIHTKISSHIIGIVFLR